MPAENNLLRSEEVNEIISKRPGFLVRWGIPLFFLVLVGILTAGWFIEYPDIIYASAKIISIDSQKEVVSNTGGKITKLLVRDGVDVHAGEILGCLENTADESEVVALSKSLDSIQSLIDNQRMEDIPGYGSTKETGFTHLGELQPAQQLFVQSFLNFRDYLSAGFFIAKKKMLRKDLQNSCELLRSLNTQKELEMQDLAITAENFKVHDTLHHEKLITDIEYRAQKSQLINKKLSVPQINANIINNRTLQNTLLKEMLDLDNQISQQKNIFVQALSVYRSKLADWKQQFLLTAPVEGKVMIPGFLEENQQVMPGKPICYIVNETNKYYAEMLIPQTNFGKVKTGQEVLLNLSAYPSQEFGSVRGVIEYIKTLPVDSGYLAKLNLPQGLITNNHVKIQVANGLTASAEIITAKRRLTERILGSFTDLFR